MNILFSTVGRRGYIVNYFKQMLNSKTDCIIGTSDRNNCDSEFTSAFHYCDKTYIVPSIKNESEYIQELLKICKKERIDILLSFYDLDSFVISKYINKFKDIGITPIISSFQVNEIAFDKLKTYNFLKNSGFMTPKTWTSVDALNYSSMQFPVIIKPRFGFGSNYIHIANNKEEMEFFINYNKTDELIVQEFLNGQEYSFDILNDLNSKTIVSVVKKKLKMRSGETDQGYAIENENLLKEAYKLGKLLKHIGPLDVDFFMINENPYILELNPRFGGGYPISHIAGANFPKLIIDMVKNNLNSDYSIYQKYKTNKVMIKDINILEGNCNYE